jgi:ERCC4-type nuclease
LVELRKEYSKLLLIDDREPLEFAELISANCPIPVDFQRLKTGDYVCEDVIIERKTINDFAGSLTGKKKRMFTQFDRLKKCKRPFLVISGCKDDLISKINYHAIIGAKAYLAANGVTVVQEESDDDLAYLILKILEKCGKFKLMNGFLKTKKMLNK